MIIDLAALLDFGKEVGGELCVLDLIYTACAAIIIGDTCKFGQTVQTLVVLQSHLAYRLN